MLEGRRLLDSIIDMRTPSITLIIRNAFGGAYASLQLALHRRRHGVRDAEARIAVMDAGGGTQFVYKDELRAIEADVPAGDREQARPRPTRRARATRTLAELLRERYERELMNPKEALSLGSVSRIVMPGTSRRVLGAEPRTS